MEERVQSANNEKRKKMHVTFVPFFFFDPFVTFLLFHSFLPSQANNIRLARIRVHRESQRQSRSSPRNTVRDKHGASTLVWLAFLNPTLFESIIPWSASTLIPFPLQGHFELQQHSAMIELRLKNFCWTPSRITMRRQQHQPRAYTTLVRQ